MCVCVKRSGRLKDAVENRWSQRDTGPPTGEKSMLITSKQKIN